MSALLFAIVMAILGFASQSAFAAPSRMDAGIGRSHFVADGIAAVTFAKTHCLDHDSPGHSDAAAGAAHCAVAGFAVLATPQSCGIWLPRVERLTPNVAHALVYALSNSLFRPPRGHA